MIHVVFQGGDEHELEEAQAQMSCKIDFINSQISSELKTVVSDWYDALQENSNDHKMVKFILKYDEKIQSLVVFSFLTTSIILLNFIYSKALENNYSFLPVNELQRLYLFLTCSIGTFYLFYQIGKFAALKMMNKQINNLKRDPMFEFTKGDKNKLIETRKENSKLIKNIFFTIGIGLIVNAISALIAYFF